MDYLLNLTDVMNFAYNSKNVVLNLIINGLSSKLARIRANGGKGTVYVLNLIINGLSSKRTYRTRWKAMGRRRF